MGRIRLVGQIGPIEPTGSMPRCAGWRSWRFALLSAPSFSAGNGCTSAALLQWIVHFAYLEKDQAGDQEEDAGDGDHGAGRLLDVRRGGVGAAERGLRADQKYFPDAGDDADDEELLHDRLDVVCLQVSYDRLQQLQHNDHEEKCAEQLQAAVQKEARAAVSLFRTGLAL